MNKFNWTAIAVVAVAFFFILSRAYGAAEREALAAEAARDTLRLVVVADSVERVRDREDFAASIQEALTIANKQRDLRERAEARITIASAERDRLVASAGALPDSVTVVPRLMFDSVVVTSRRIEVGLREANATLVADTVRLADLLGEASRGWTKEIASHSLTKQELTLTSAIAESWRRAANPGFLGKLWDGKEEFLGGVLTGIALSSSRGN